MTQAEQVKKMAQFSSRGNFYFDIIRKDDRRVIGTVYKEEKPLQEVRGHSKRMWYSVLDTPKVVLDAMEGIRNIGNTRGPFSSKNRATLALLDHANPWYREATKKLKESNKT